MNIYFNNISQSQQKRTKKLLYNTRKMYGIDMYLLLKAILIPPMISEYYQSHGYPQLWVHYEIILKRNEGLYHNHKPLTMDKLLQSNTFHSPQFFSIPTQLLTQYNFTQIINMSINHWNEALNDECY